MLDVGVSPLVEAVKVQKNYLLRLHNGLAYGYNDFQKNYECV